jgi:Ca2+-binding RTX toxin-like protein
MLTAIKNWLGDSKSTSKPRQAKLGLENLADRVLLSAAVVDGELRINGTGRHDVVQVSREFILDEWWVRVSERIRTGDVLSSPSISGFREAGIDRIVFKGRDGDDKFTNDTAIESCANGGDGNDSMFGGSGRDVLCGDGRKDHLYGRDGNDVLNGNGGDDFMVGGAGHDFLWGGDGWDAMLGSGGNDVLLGGSGLDNMDGGAGVDWLDGGVDDHVDALVGGTSGDAFVRHHGRRADRIVDFETGVDRIVVR